MGWDSRLWPLSVSNPRVQAFTELSYLKGGGQPGTHLLELLLTMLL